MVEDIKPAIEKKTFQCARWAATRKHPESLRPALSPLCVQLGHDLAQPTVGRVLVEALVPVQPHFEAGHSERQLEVGPPSNETSALSMSGIIPILVYYANARERPDEATGMDRKLEEGPLGTAGRSCGRLRLCAASRANRRKALPGKTAAWLWFRRCIGGCRGLARRHLSGRVHSPIRRADIRVACIPEEIEVGCRYTEAGHRSDQK